MDEFWRGLFLTYQLMPDWLKAMWLVVPAGMVLWLALLGLKHKGRPPVEGELMYSVYRQQDGSLAFVSARPDLESVAEVLFLRQAIGTAQLEHRKEIPILLHARP